MAVEMLKDRCAARASVAREKDRGGYQKTRRAEAALQGVVLAEGSLQSGQPIRPEGQSALKLGQCPDRLDSAAIGLHGQQEPGAARHTGDADRTRAADALAARHMHARGTGAIAQEVT